MKISSLHSVLTSNLFALHVRNVRPVATLRRCVGLIAASIGFTACTASEPVIDLKNFQSSLDVIRVNAKLPALGAALVSSEGVQHLATTGIRKRGDKTPVTNDDLWHLGSDGKAMTATMVARLVEKGQMKWEQMLGETFPELAPKMSAEMKAITLTQLLSHRGGLDANFNLVNYVGKSDLMKARIEVIEEAAKSKLKSKPGEKHLYSNWGYVIAGAMAERAAGKSWEQLMRDEVFAPLNMKSAGFGGTGSVGNIDQPWPHTANGKPAESNGPEMDNLPVMSPAGTIHMTLADWGRFVAEHMRGAQGKSTFLKKETFAILQTPIANDYAMGWIAASRSWAGGMALNHAGDNTLNFALVWAAPQKDFAILVVTNQSGAFEVADGVVGALIKAQAAK